MLKVLLPVAVVLFFANTLQAREAVITWQRVETNSVISDPTLMKVKISGSVESPVGSCESTRGVATLEQTEVEGKIILTPTVTLLESLSDKACPDLEQDLGTMKLNVSLIFKKEDLQKVVMLNSQELGRRIEAKDLFEGSFVPFPIAETCEDLARPDGNCAVVRSPTTCTHGEFEVHAENFCTAKRNLMRRVCGEGVVFELSLMTCQSKTRRLPL